MKINLPFRYLISINRQFKPKKVIVPIGYDCHPADLLSKKTLRKQSLPFDWLLTSPLFALDYAYFNIKNNFKFFLNDLKLNNEGKVYAHEFSTTLFYHYDDLVTNGLLQNKLKERCNKLVKLYNNKEISFLFVIPVISLESNESVKKYVASIKLFLELLKDTDELLIYVRFENSFSENITFYEKLIKEVSDFKKLKVATLLLESDQYGLWGNENNYSRLLNDLGVEYKQVFPKVTFSKDSKKAISK